VTLFKALGQRASAGRVRTQVELAEALRRGQRLEAENLALRDNAADAASKLPRIIAESQAMKSVLKLVERIGPADANVSDYRWRTVRARK